MAILFYLDLGLCLSFLEPILQRCVLISRGCKPFCKLSPAQEERAGMWRGRRRGFASQLLRVALCRLDLIPR